MTTEDNFPYIENQRYWYVRYKDTAIMSLLRNFEMLKPVEFWQYPSGEHREAYLQYMKVFKIKDNAEKWINDNFIKQSDKKLFTEKDMVKAYRDGIKDCLKGYGTFNLSKYID